MTWDSFKEEASKISPRWFFKQSQRGFEVWEKAVVAGPGYPTHYIIMLIPKFVQPIQWICYLRSLKEMDWTRRRNEQVKKIQEMDAHNKAIYKNREQRAESAFKDFAKETRSILGKEADEQNVSETAIRLKMKDVLWDDTKRVMREELEKRGAYQ